MFEYLEKPTVLCIFSHPDDDELSCFGTLAKLQVEQNANIFIVELTDGTRSYNNLSSLRRNESRAAAALIGGEVIEADFTDGEVKFDARTITFVDQILSQIDPSIVITHSPSWGFVHQDHTHCANSVINSCIRHERVKILLLSEPTAQIQGFIPNLFIDITEFFETKLKAINIHRTESHKHYMQRTALLTRSQWWSYQAHPEYRVNERLFEAFTVVKMVS
jgi:LmbE family N-acetylglucosaminyl deacetylase